MNPLLTIQITVLEFNKDKVGGQKMADVFDVAKCILNKQGAMTTMKLQKLVYYCQAWSLVWDGQPLFDGKIQAWASGPVVRELYDVHKGQLIISDIPVGDINNLEPEEIETINAVLEAYGNKQGQWLADLTHMESPWNEAREGYALGDNCENEITPTSMEEYYSSLSPDGEPV